MLLSQLLTCCGCKTMGSICAKQTDPDYLQHPHRSKHKKVKKQVDEEEEPLVDQLPNKSKLNHDDIKDYEVIPHEERSSSSSPASTPPPSTSTDDDDEEDKQLQEVIPDAEEVIPDIEQPEYSKNSDDNYTPTDKAITQNEEEEEEENDIDNQYMLPTSLGSTPHESMRIMDAEDQEFAQEIRNKYAHKLQQHPLDKMNFVERYVLGYKHIKKKKRMTAISADIDYFFLMHEKYDVDNIIKTTSDKEELNAWKQFVYGEDNCGHPIMYDLIGSGDCKQMKEVFMKKDQAFGDTAMMHMFRFMRKIENYKAQNTKKYGVKIYQQIQVLDMAGFTADHLKGKNRKMTKLMIEALTRMFPEGTYKMYIINAPWPFRAIWKGIKGFMDPITVAKTKVIGEDYLVEMIKDIPIQMIPQKYGGKGVWQIQYGTIPKHYPIDVYHGLD